MASSDLTNQAPSIIPGGMPGPLPESQQQRHWIPDERDAFIHWLKGEFAAANAIIDTLCHHLQVVGKPGEYDFVLNCIQQRRFNWAVVLHMQQYFSVAEVVFALQQVVWMKHTLNSDPSALQMAPFGASDNGGSHSYRDPRAPPDPMMPGIAVLQHPVVPEEVYTGRRDSMEVPRRTEEHMDRRRSSDVVIGDQERQQTLGSSSSLENVMYANRDQADQADRSLQQGPSRSGSTSMTSLSESSTTSSVAAFPQTAPSVRGEKEMDHESHEQQPNAEEASSIKLDRPEENAAERTFGFASKEEEDKRQANVKVTRSYSCIEQVEGKSVNFVDGLELYERVLDKAESSKLASLILEMRAGKKGESAGAPTIGSKKGTKGKGRDSLLLNFSNAPSAEDHRKRSSPKDESLQSLPAFLDPVIERLVRWHIIPASKRPDSCCISIMEEGDYVPPSVDKSHLERPYCTLTLLGDCNMIMGQSLMMDSPGDFKGSLQILLPVGSVLVLQRNSAEIARHSIAPSQTKRIFITLGKAASVRPQKGLSPSATGTSPPVPQSIPSSSWNSSFTTSNNNNNSSTSGNHNRQGHGTLTHSNSTGRTAGERYGSSFKNHKFSPAASSGVLPVPTARPPANIITSPPTTVPPLFSGTPGPAGGGAFPSPSMAMPPSWSPLPRPPPPNRPPTAGTGVFFPAGGASSGPGRPMNMSTGGQRRAGSISPAPPILQKTNSAPASFASLEAVATAASSSPSTPPSKSSKPTSAGVSSSSEKSRASPSSPSQDPKALSVSESSDSSSSSQTLEPSGVARNSREEISTGGRNQGTRSKSLAGNSNRTSVTAQS
ncbi:hypothetical protein R1flu_020665 [Riccia fluitans]|uniref:Uncharacterized protein n=1 Tax=Riccia fluitans TaxID=41844 RepID=A0ABD1ZNC7_9MARC